METLNSQSNLKKKDRFGGTNLNDYGHQDSMALAQNRNINQWNKKAQTPMGTLSLTKDSRIHNIEKTASSISGAGKTGQLHVKE